MSSPSPSSSPTAAPVPSAAVVDAEEQARFDRALKRGAFFNVLGLIAKLVQPLFVVVVTWLWGPGLIGPYLLAFSFMEILSGAIVAGYADATTLYASRHIDAAKHDPEQRRALYGVLSNALACTLVAGVFCALAAQLSAGWLVGRFFPQYRELLPGLYFMLWALIPRSASQVAIAATKATMRMEYDAMLNGVAQPLSLLACAVAAYALGGRLTALCAAHLVAEAFVCLLAGRVFCRLFDAPALLSAVRNFHVDRGLLGFAIPQSLNLTFNRYIARLSGIMLASFGLQPVELGYFSTAALLTSNLSQIRLVLSGALAPVAARHHSAGDKAALEAALNRVARWATSMVVPVALACVVLREDVMRLVSRAYHGHSLFVAVLLIPPFVGCAYGIAGSSLVYTGHSRVNLLNSAVVALLSTGLSYGLIPRYGVLGAASATALAASSITALQMVELWWIERVRIRWASVWKPHVGLALGGLLLCILWDPATLSAAAKTVTVAGLLVGYALLMLALGHEELSGLLRKRRD